VAAALPSPVMVRAAAAGPHRDGEGGSRSVTGMVSVVTLPSSVMVRGAVGGLGGMVRGVGLARLLFGF